jgi:hypothetical protein
MAGRVFLKRYAKTNPAEIVRRFPAELSDYRASAGVEGGQMTEL